MRNITLAALTVTLAMPAVASAQVAFDATTLRDIEDINVVTADGDDLGEVESVLVDATGNPAAVAVEVGGFLGIGDSDRVLPLDRLVYQGDRYVVTITREEVEALPEWDD